MLNVSTGPEFYGTFPKLAKLVEVSPRERVLKAEKRGAWLAVAIGLYIFGPLPMLIASSQETVTCLS